MGFAKRTQQEQWDQGWNFSGKSVCSSCVDEEHLAAVIDNNAEADTRCSFCGEVPASPLDILMAAFVTGVKNVYGTADNEMVPYDSSEGGYQISTTDTWDLVHEEFGDVFSNDKLTEEVSELMEEQTWIQHDWAWRSRDEVLIESWQEFCDTVKYKTRYVMWLKNDYDSDERWRTGEIPPALILEEIGKLINHVDILTVTLPAGYALYRARAHKESEQFITGAEIGTAPSNFAAANRMSPAGIGMFYGAENQSTALGEVSIHTKPEETGASVGRFTTSRPIKVIDLTRLPKNVNMFHPVLGHFYQQMRFLEHFVEELRKLATDEHIDYVPTQIITEYLLQVYDSDGHIDGILYTSAVDGQTCAVLDVDNARCRDNDHEVASDELLMILREAQEYPLPDEKLH